MNTIPILAGIAAILLTVELLIVMIIVGAAVYLLRRGLIVGRQKAVPYIQQVTEQVRRVEALTEDYSTLIVGSQVEAISTVRGIRRGVQVLLRETGTEGESEVSGET